MSRANARVAHTLRESESIRINKTILKAGAYDAASASSEVSATLEASNDHYLERLSQLKKFSSSKKTKAKITSLHSEWTSEQLRLQSLAHKLETSVSDLLRQVLMATPEHFPIIELLQQRDGDLEEFKSFRSRAAESIHSVRELMRESKKMAAKQQQQQRQEQQQLDSGSSNNDTNAFGNMAAASILAELLMNQRMENSTSLSALTAEESALKALVATQSHQISKMLRCDRNLRQDEQLRDEFTAILRGTESAVLERVNDSSIATAVATPMSSRTGCRTRSTTPTSTSTSSAATSRIATAVDSSSSKSTRLTAIAENSSNTPTSAEADVFISEVVTEAIDSTQEAIDRTNTNYSESAHQPLLNSNSHTSSSNSICSELYLSDLSTAMSNSNKQQQQQQQSISSARSKLGSVQSTASSVAAAVEMELEMVMDEWLTSIAELDKTHEISLIEREKSKVEFCVEVGIDAAAANGGWDDSSHSIFAKIYKKAQVTGMTRKSMLEAMQAQISSSSSSYSSIEAITAHEEWWRKLKLIAAKYKDSDAVYRTARVDLIAEAKTALLLHRQQRIDNCVKDAELAEQERQRAAVHRRLLELKAQKEVTDATKRHEFLLQQETMLREQQEKEEAAAQERQQQRELLAQYQQQRQQAQQQQQRAIAAASEAAERSRRLEIEMNKPKVAQRAQLLNEKEQKKQQRQQELAAEEMRRLDELMKLAQQVPYWSALQEATSKLEHVTASARGHEYTAPLLLPSRGHLPLLGFDNARIVSDTRSRLAEALRQCGLQHSQAAREAVARFHPRPQLAIHGLL